jgi:hypothetical protein
MINEKLIEKLSKLNPKAEVGYELKQIAYVHGDENDEYIDLGWSGVRYGKDKVQSTGVFVLISKYTDFYSENGRVKVNGEEINGVFSTRKKAEKMGNWLLKTSKESPDDFGEDETLRIYNSYEVRNFLIL